MTGLWAGLESSWDLMALYSILNCVLIFYLWQSMLAFLVW